MSLEAPDSALPRLTLAVSAAPMHHALQWIKPCFLIFLSLLFMLALPRAAQAVVVEVGSQNKYLVSANFDFLQDPGGTLRLQDVLAQSSQRRFQPVHQGGASSNCGLYASAYWFRVLLKLSPHADTRWLLELVNPQ